MNNTLYVITKFDTMLQWLDKGYRYMSCVPPSATKYTAVLSDLCCDNVNVQLESLIGKKPKMTMDDIDVATMDVVIYNNGKFYKVFRG